MSGRGEQRPPWTSPGGSLAGRAGSHERLRNTQNTRIGVHFQGKTGQAALDQIRAVDQTRLVKKLGAVPEPTSDGVAGILVEMFTRG
jgi:mRNA-degrading endonuclease toxin of MazEF toxin-antitoxin module